MDEHSYLNFELLIERYQGNYLVRILNSPAGQATREFEVPFSDLEIENFILRVGRSRRGVRRLDSPEMELSRRFGGKLFESIFNDEVRDRLRTSIGEASRQDRGLRIQLRMTDVPELVNLPWEYLYDPDLKQFLVLSTQTPIVRFLDLPRRIQPLQLELPLNLLVMISSPSDYPSLDVEEEWRRLQQSLEVLQQQGIVHIERIEKATLTYLQQRLRKKSYNIFHFIGHGGFDESTEDGILLFEDDARKGHQVSGDYLGTLLHDEPSIRLAVLNACEGARTSYSDPFAGVAQRLVLRGIPSVIAMQFEITDEAALVFAREFYGALADGYPVDASLAEARKAIYTQGNDIEWGTPVLYLRAPDGRIFDISQVPSREVAPSVSLALDTKELSVVPGEVVSTRITVQNFGSDPANLGLTVLGIPESWIQDPLPDLQLSPGEQQEIRLTIQPPRTPASRAGQYPLTYRIVNKDAPEQAFTEQSTLTVAKFSQTVSNLHPKNIHVGEKVSIELRNEGNTQETSSLVVEDLSGSLDIHPSNAELKLSEGKTASWEFKVDPLTKSWFSGKRSHPFNVKITSSSGSVQRHRGEAISSGLIPLWVIPAIIFLCFVLSAGGVRLYQMYNPLPITGRTQTATAPIGDLKDSDRDGLSDSEEQKHGTDPNIRDTDGDGLIDGEEINEFGTIPTDRDTDRDTLLDGEEVFQFRTNPANRDTDGDSLFDGEEARGCTSPTLPDTDGDGQNDNVDPAPCDLPTDTPSPSPIITFTPTITSTIPEPSDTPSPSPTEAKDVRFENHCIDADVWTPSPIGSLQKDGENCWRLSDWGLEAQDNRLTILSSYPNGEMINGIYTQLEGDVTIDFDVRAAQLWTSVDDVLTNIAFGILPDNLSLNSGRLIFYQKESPADGYPVFLKSSERGGFDAYLTQNGDYIRYNLGSVNNIRMTIVGNELNIYVDEYLVSGPTQVTFPNRVFWIGYRLPRDGIIEAYISNLVVQDN